jgi:c-di-GMP-binding flagellar brake protein YcgR
VLEYTALRGLYKQRGVARFDVNGDEAVRFVGGTEPELIQRREFVRVDVNIPVSVWLKDGWPMEFDAMNLSGSGILLAPPSGKAKQLTIGMFLSLKIPLYDEKPAIEVRGSVVREAGRGAMGVRFDHISEADQERLVRYVARQEREQRRRMGEL